MKHRNRSTARSFVIIDENCTLPTNIASLSVLSDVLVQKATTYTDRSRPSSVVSNVAVVRCTKQPPSRGEQTVLVFKMICRPGVNHSAVTNKYKVCRTPSFIGEVCTPYQMLELCLVVGCSRSKAQKEGNHARETSKHAECIEP